MDFKPIITISLEEYLDANKYRVRGSVGKNCKRNSSKRFFELRKQRIVYRKIRTIEVMF